MNTFVAPIIHTHTHTHTYLHAHTRTHARTHTHTHIHTYSHTLFFITICIRIRDKINICFQSRQGTFAQKGLQRLRPNTTQNQNQFHKSQFSGRRAPDPRSCPTRTPRAMCVCTHTQYNIYLSGTRRGDLWDHCGRSGGTLAPEDEARQDGDARD